MYNIQIVKVCEYTKRTFKLQMVTGNYLEIQFLKLHLNTSVNSTVLWGEIIGNFKFLLYKNNH